MNPQRRKLTFSSLDRIMPDVDHLLNGHDTIGKWSFGQICNHLTGAIINSVDGYPLAAPWIFRRTFGPLIIRRALAIGAFSEGLPIPKQFLPKTCDDTRAEAEALRAALTYFAGHTGTLATHPLGPNLTHAEWDRFHSIHCAHHLSFVLPTPSV